MVLANTTRGTYPTIPHFATLLDTNPQKLGQSPSKLHSRHQTKPGHWFGRLLWRLRERAQRLRGYCPSSPIAVPILDSYLFRVFPSLPPPLRQTSPLEDNMDDLAINPEILRHLPHGRFLLTAHHGDKRTGIITPWVAPCSDEPILLTVSVPRGSLVEPLIRDSRRFTLGVPCPEDRVVPRRFHDELKRDEDPFVGVMMHELPNGGLMPASCPHWIECQLSGHLAPDSGHRVYLGLVVATSLPTASSGKGPALVESRSA